MRHLVAFAALALAACVPPPADAQFRAVPAALDPADPLRSRFGLLEWRGGLMLSGDGIGGLSALTLDGDVLTALNDRGAWFRVRLQGSDDRLTGALPVDGGRLAGLDGQPLAPKRLTDSEGLARLPEGLVVSFERVHRLWLYAPDLSARPRPLDGPRALQTLPPNGGVEAVTELGDGRLLLIAEDGGDEFHVPAWVGRPGQAWQPLSYRREGQFRPCGAALLPDGRVVVLERRFTALGGIAARLAVLEADALDGPELAGRELARLEPPLAVDNFEGIAAGRTADGRTLIVIVSDDNFFPLQTTLLHAFVLP